MALASLEECWKGNACLGQVWYVPWWARRESAHSLNYLITISVCFWGNICEYLAAAGVELCSGQCGFGEHLLLRFFAASVRGLCLWRSRPADDVDFGSSWWVLKALFCMDCVLLGLMDVGQGSCLCDVRGGCFQCILIPEMTASLLAMMHCTALQLGIRILLKWLLSSCLEFLARKFPACSILVWLDYLAKNICEGVVINFSSKQWVSCLKQVLFELSLRCCCTSNSTNLLLLCLSWWATYLYPLIVACCLAVFCVYILLSVIGVVIGVVIVLISYNRTGAEE